MGKKSLSNFPITASRAAQMRTSKDNKLMLAGRKWISFLKGHNLSLFLNLPFMYWTSAELPSAVIKLNRSPETIELIIKQPTCLQFRNAEIQHPALTDVLSDFHHWKADKHKWLASLLAWVFSQRLNFISKTVSLRIIAEEMIEAHGVALSTSRRPWFTCWRQFASYACCACCRSWTATPSTVRWSWPCSCPCSLCSHTGWPAPGTSLGGRR